VILAVIPARGGSKGLPKKNLRELAGAPLLQWTIEAAQESAQLDRIVVSTEDAEISRFAHSMACEVLDRPASLATDDATTVDVLQHAVQEIPEADVVVLLQPTSPIRFRGLIDKAIERFFNTGCDTLATGYISYDYEWCTMASMPRQAMQGFFYDDGNVYVHKAEYLREGKWWGDKREAWVTDSWYNIELDTIADFWMAQGIIWQLKK
jgi:CMP-N-acetylneuraminic acid synthetase